MNDETKPTETAVESETKEETLEDVYKELNVEQEAQQFEAQPKETKVEAEDPFYDDALAKQLSELKSEISSMREETQKVQIESDIKQAVKAVSEQAEGVKPRVIEALLEAQAAEDPKFKTLWDNRKSNPDAWKRALGAFSKGVADDFKVKQDPQLTENLRAASQSQSAMSSQAPDQNEEWDVDEDEFNSKWNSLQRG